ncbi:MAG: response regulator transcription factor [Desulfuromonadales bacterium]|nr:response regulator transcription factor [Desulfuromonadales bacterium]
MKQAHVLLVEDETNIALGLLYNLETEGYRATHVETCQSARAAFRQQRPDLVVLDLMLPDGHGLTLCREFRADDPQLPILILTALGEERARIDGLAAGADDYLTKPFSLDEFLLRVAGMLRRSGWYRPVDDLQSPYRFGDNIVDLANLGAETATGPIRLTELEGRMLQTFFAAEGQTLTRVELLKSVWGLSADTETRTLDNFIVRLRKYFEQDPANPRHFLTVRGRGYRFER